MGSDFLDMQAAVGISKHIGGLPASRRLAALCNVAAAREVLDIGCGIGVEPARIASTTSARVVGLDVSDRMLAWADGRAREAGVRDRIDLVRGDVLALPFDDGRFDAVLCESVLAFVADKERAIAEMVRVTRPGGRVGLNEAFYLSSAPQERIEALTRALGAELIALDGWRDLWSRSGLEDRVIRACRTEPGREVRDRIRWIGIPWLLAAWVRVARLYATDPSSRPLMQEMLGATVEKVEDGDAGARRPAGPEPIWTSFGYALLAGRRPS